MSTDQHAAAMQIVHTEAGRTLSQKDFDLCMRIAKSALRFPCEVPVNRADGDAIHAIAFHTALVLEMSELCDRNSPEDEPDAMIANSDEMEGCIERALERTGLSLRADGDAVPVAINQHIERLAREVEVECLAGSGVSFYMVAEMAIERTIEMLMDQSMQVAEVCQDADGFKHIEAVIEELDDIPAGTRLYLAAPPASTRCEYCDGTGDVHGLDGEWRGTCTECAAPSADTSGRSVPANVRAALDRMCSPLDKSRLTGVTAEEDARCMKMIRDYVLASRSLPAELTPPVRNVLSLMLWQTLPIANALRASGRHINRKNEDEQAAALHWLLGIALEHGEDWESAAARALHKLLNEKKGT